MFCFLLLVKLLGLALLNRERWKTVCPCVFQLQSGFLISSSQLPSQNTDQKHRKENNESALQLREILITFGNVITLSSNCLRKTNCYYALITPLYLLTFLPHQGSVLEHMVSLMFKSKLSATQIKHIYKQVALEAMDGADLFTFFSSEKLKVRVEYSMSIETHFQ